ncbi:sensor histidine kinase [Robertkochia solimangrovi]|uniref:sensor histidine kinase n=1 Tax=Robertkochia solimangrovi TaxID=2213046 RepID=UPI001F554E1E|nr:sensor histidine kinase [Robertkochia solimangrovi]
MEYNQLKNNTHLILRVNYFSSILMLLLAPVCYYLLNIKGMIPGTFLFYGIMNLLNTFLFYKHRNLTIIYIFTTLLGLSGALIVTLYSGGINSPFIFVLALIVFAGYISTRRYGIIHLYVISVLIIITFLLSYYNMSFPNQVPPESQNIFSLISILFTVYILGGIFGKILQTNYRNLYNSKKKLEIQSRQKEILLKEIHHRVKNNLQTVSSLLSLQSRSVPNSEMKGVLINSQNRVISMALIHEMLYANDDISKIQYEDYVGQLARHLIQSIKGKQHNIKLEIEIPDIKLGIDTAIPLGLLINEFITNTLKHGIRNDEAGTITIRLNRMKDNSLLLQLGDNGIGFQNNGEIPGNKTLGLRLIHNLVKQLKGTMELDKEKSGVNYNIRFTETASNVKARESLG